MPVHADDAPVLSERHGHTLVLTLNRPDARNAVDASLWRAMADALDAASQDDDIRAVVLVGAGDRAFCAGADLRAVSRGEALAPAGGRYAALGFAGVVRHPIEKPLIAAVNGAALGGGLEIVLACDLVVASSEAIFGLPEVRRGLIASEGGVVRLPRQMPQRIALEMIYTGQPISAQRALALGLVNEVVEPARVRTAALAFAQAIGEGAPLAVRACKRIARLAVGELPDGAGASCSASVAWERMQDEHAQLMGTADTAEGVRAFIEKRAPRWTAR